MPSTPGVRPETPMLALRAFVADLRATMGRRLPMAALLVVASSLAEGSVLLLLIPVLQSLGLDGSALGGTPGGALRDALNAQDRPPLETALTLFVAAATLQALLLRWQSRITYALEHEYVANWRGRLYRAIARAPWSFIVGRRLSDLAHTLATDLQKAGIAAYQLTALATAVALTAVYVAVAFWISPLLTAAAGTLALVPFVAGWRGLRRSSQSGEQVVAANAAVHHAAIEHLSGAKTARSYGATERNTRLFDELASDVVRVNARLMGDHADDRAVVQIASAVLLALLVVAAAKVLVLPAADVLVLLLVFVRLVPRVGAIHAGALNLSSLLPAFTSASRLLEEAEAARPPAVSAARPITFENRLEFHDVGYAYPAAARQAVSDVTFSITRGATVGIAGPSGSGKTTLADLMLGLIEPQAGRIRVDGVDLTPEVVDDWRSKIGYVSQDTFLFHDTIRANLLWAAPGASEADLWSALARVAADVFVRALPAGLETVLGDRGVRLSGGERQRLALARAFLRSPALLILDEATSALDPENEQAIMDTLAAERGRLTVVLITHRLGLLRDADVIHVVDDGKIVESGTWKSLTAQSRGRLTALAQTEHSVQAVSRP
jgi:ATP-binding cassette subfamily C protein